MAIQLKKKRLIALGAAGAAIVLCVFYYAMWGTQIPKSLQQKFILPASSRYDVWPAFHHSADIITQSWFQDNCVSGDTTFSIENLGEILSSWRRSTDSKCMSLLKKFEAIYSVSTRHASLLLPGPFQGKVKKWLGNNEVLYKEVYDQKVIHVVNTYTREHTVFSPLRDKRPVSVPEKPEAQYLQEILKQTTSSCDFCNFRNFTAEHTFHRVESKYAFSASNTFKMDPLHALFVFRRHDPIGWTADEFIDLMNLTNTWFHKAQSNVAGTRYPSVVWDILPKCGASQVHPHLHGFLDGERYHGVVEAWRLAAQDYHIHMRTNFYTDMADIALALGLGVSYKSAVAFASIVPRKDHEVVVMAPAADKDFFQLLYFVLRAFLDDLGKFCFSMGLGYPSLQYDDRGRIPAYARIITRGAVTEIRADISSLELFAATNVNVDPFKVIQVVKDSLQKRRSVFLPS